MTNQAVENVQRIVVSHMMTPDMVNFSGTIHGGHVLLLLDQTAYACAVKYSRHNVVTLSVDHRVIDGALGAQLLTAIKGNLENPLGMLA